MRFGEYRRQRGLTLEQCCPLIGLGLKSKGHLSRLESGQIPWPLRLALRVEAWSGGEVRAADLVHEKDAALLEVIQPPTSQAA
jgi:transcriptional regulator with XRE-family HTH domain